MRCLFCNAEREPVLSESFTLEKTPDIYSFHCVRDDHDGCGLRYYIEGSLKAAEVHLTESERKRIRSQIALANTNNKTAIVLFWRDGSIYPVSTPISGKDDEP
jgi:hypothetical protein